MSPVRRFAVVVQLRQSYSGSSHHISFYSRPFQHERCLKGELMSVDRSRISALLERLSFLYLLLPVLLLPKPHVPQNPFRNSHPFPVPHILISHMNLTSEYSIQPITPPIVQNSRGHTYKPAGIPQ